MKETLIIRADSTVTTGIGHIMRCIALGQAWQEHGGDVIFVSHCQRGEVSEGVFERFRAQTYKEASWKPFVTNHI